jgi:hypothetical protein
MNLKKKGTKRAMNIDRTGSLGRKRKLSTAEILSKLTRFAKKTVKISNTTKQMNKTRRSEVLAFPFSQLSRAKLTDWSIDNV